MKSRNALSQGICRQRVPGRYSADVDYPMYDNELDSRGYFIPNEISEWGYLL